MLIIGPNGDYATFTSGQFTFRKGFTPLEATTTRGIPKVKVTAKWGYAADVPDDIFEAIIMQAARTYKRLQGSMSDALASGELGQLLYPKFLIW